MVIGSWLPVVSHVRVAEHLRDPDRSGAASGRCVYNSEVDQHLTCFVGYSKGSISGARVERIFSLRAVIERTTRVMCTHCSVSTNQGVLQPTPRESEELCRALTAAANPQIYDVEYCRFADGFSPNSYKMVQVVRVRDKQINNEYATVYVHYPFSSSEVVQEREDSFRSVFESMDSVFEIGYGFATVRRMEESPSSYFVDEARGRGYALADRVNAPIWNARRSEVWSRVRGVFDANLLSEDHLDKLGGYQHATEIIGSRVPGATLGRFDSRRALLFAFTEGHRLSLRELFSEYGLLIENTRHKKTRL